MDNNHRKLILSEEAQNKLESRPISPPTTSRIGDLVVWYSGEIDYYNNFVDELECLSQVHSSCAPGCSLCCNYPIQISRFEMFLIRATLENHLRAFIPAIRAKTIIIIERLEAIRWRQRQEDAFTNNHSEKFRNQLIYEYFSLGLKCPLLDENGKCLVYKVRPAPCWSFRCYGNPKQRGVHIDDISVNYHGLVRLSRDSYRFFLPQKYQSLELLPYALFRLFI